jgi:hypothetical protein
MITVGSSGGGGSGLTAGQLAKIDSINWTDVTAIKAKTDRIRKKHLGLKVSGSRGLTKPHGMKFDWSVGRYVREQVK